MHRLARWLSRRDARAVSQALNPVKTVKIEGILFKLKKINPMDYLAGFKAMAQMYETYKVDKNNPIDIVNMKKIREHYIEVFTAAVTEPVLSRKPDCKDALYVEMLFNNWELTEKLYLSILEFTYGKKKLRQLNSQKKSWWN